MQIAEMVLRSRLGKTRKVESMSKSQRTERPILFSGPMVRAILEGRKTQTRRVMKPQPISFEEDSETFEANMRPDCHAMAVGHSECPPGYRRMRWWRFDRETDGRLEFLRPAVGERPTKAQARRASEWLHRYQRDGVRWSESEVIGLCPYGKPGDRLWVRETWALRNDIDPAKEPASARHYALYKASYDGVFEDEWHDVDRWRPSIHMPRILSRITLEITGVRVERLQAISDDDAKAEGLPIHVVEQTFRKCYRDAEERARMRVACFAELWRRINGPESWDANPWVWVIAFKVLSDVAPVAHDQEAAAAV